jgi:uncharacterized membrane protein YgcG
MKKIEILKAAILSLSIIILLFSQVGCSAFEIDSLWREKEILIDGNSSDWLGALVYLEDNGVSVGIQNDEHDLYICLLAESSFLRSQVMRRGFTLWFDPAGGKDKTFGIKFPLGLPIPETRPQARIEPIDRIDREQKLESMESLNDKLEILGPGKADHRMIPLNKVKGIEVFIEAASGLLVYELKVPLKQSEDYPYAIKASAGDTLGIGFEMPKLDREALRGERPDGAGIRSGGGVSGGMAGKGGMRGGGGRSGGRGGMSRSRPEVGKGLKIWVKTLLAEDK